jgi:hypothetical protein
MHSGGDRVNSARRGQHIHHQHNQTNNKSSAAAATISRKFGQESSSAEEEFFCLTPEDARSITSSTTSDRSRNASTTSGQIPDTKIFSVAVEAKAKDANSSLSGGLDSMLICDVDTDYTGRFAVVSEAVPSKYTSAGSGGGKKNGGGGSAGGGGKKQNKNNNKKAPLKKQVSGEFKMEDNAEEMVEELTAQVYFVLF